MQLKQYNELIQTEKQLQEDMKNFILNTLKANNNHIAYTSPDADNEDVSMDDKYPVISTLWGKHDTYNIAITDVYLKEYGQGSVEIYADGIDQDTETVKREFLIYPEQFSDVMYFMMAPLNEQFYKFAAQLALKDLVDKYNKLPHEFYSESGSIKHEYHRQNGDNIQKYTSQLEEIYIKCAETGCDKDEINSALMAISCDLADLALIEQNQLKMDAMTEDCDGEIRFTEEKQDEFNTLYDRIEGQLWELMNFKE